MIDLSNLFPEEQTIPKDVQLKESIEQHEYLINGELLQWQAT